MTKLERVQAAIRRQPTDRTPYAFWRHFPDVDRNAAALAQSTLRFHERYDSDFLKVTPHGGYAVEDWGCVERDEVRPDGHRPCARHGVNAPEDWKRVRPVKMESSGWATHLETIIRTVVDKRADCSTVPTVFSPLSLARKLAGDRLGYDLKENPQAVTDALTAITETILAFMEACFREGCEGIFYSVQAASATFHTEEEYQRFGEPYDRRILEAVRDRVEAHHSPLSRRAPHVRPARRPPRGRLELGRSPRGARAGGGASARCRAPYAAGSTSGARSRTGRRSRRRQRRRTPSRKPAGAASSWAPAA